MNMFAISPDHGNAKTLIHCRHCRFYKPETAEAGACARPQRIPKSVTAEHHCVWWALPGVMWRAFSCRSCSNRKPAGGSYSECEEGWRSWSRLPKKAQRCPRYVPSQGWPAFFAEHEQGARA